MSPDSNYAFQGPTTTGGSVGPFVKPQNQDSSRLTLAVFSRVWTRVPWGCHTAGWKGSPHPPSKVGEERQDIAPQYTLFPTCHLLLVFFKRYFLSSWGSAHGLYTEVRRCEVKQTSTSTGSRDQPRGERLGGGHVLGLVLFLVVLVVMVVGN